MQGDMLLVSCDRLEILNFETLSIYAKEKERLATLKTEHGISYTSIPKQVNDAYNWILFYNQKEESSITL